MKPPKVRRGERLVARVSVYRIVSEDGDMRDEVRVDDGHKDDLDVATAIGMLAIAQHTLLCEWGTE